MRRAGLLLVVFVACAREPGPAVTIPAALDGAEPTVRVHLRSLKPQPVSGKGGLRVTTLSTDLFADGPVDLTALEGAVLQPRDGVFFVGQSAFAGKLVWRDGMMVNHVTMENYVLGVLRGELPLKEVPVQAAAAQAIAVRSYTLHYLVSDAGAFDLDDTTLYQRYVGLRYAPDDSSLRAGVRATTGLYLSYRGAPLKAYYHSTCGGHTTDVKTGLDRDNVPPLTGVVCDHCKASKYYRWEARLRDAEILKAFSIPGPLRTFEVQDRGPGDRALMLRAETGGLSYQIASSFRLAVGPSRLRSTRILELTRVEGGYLVKGGGWGHGVGLCQMGAIGQARAGGTDGRKICAYYYPGATIRRAY